MKITREEVEHVAYLARVGLTDEEKERMAGQLSAILDYFEMLKELDTDAIPPTAQVLDIKNVMRADDTRPSLSNAAVLANAPDAEDGFFRVKAVLDTQEEDTL